MADRKEPTPPPADTSTRPDPPPPPPPKVADRDNVAQFPGVHQQPAGVQSLQRRDDTMAVAFQGLVPGSMGEAMQLAQHLAKSKAVPKSLQGEPESVFTIIMAGMEIGLTPIRAIQSISVISGSLAMKADLQLAQVRRSGALEYFDEGFELAGKTDESLEDRLSRTGRTPAEQSELAALAGTIMDLTNDVPEGQPYGWAISQRRSDPQKHVRVFSWLDAERFTYDEWEGPDSNRRKVKKKLSEKHAYVSTPQDMYPKRARVRVLQVTHSDVLAGMPAIEALDGTPGAIEAEVINSEVVQPTSSEDMIGQLLATIRETDATAASSIVAGFEQLQMGIAKRLQKLTEYRGNPAGLLDWLKTEYANRKSGGRGRQVKDTLGTEQAQPAIVNTPVTAAAVNQQPQPPTTPPPQPIPPPPPILDGKTEPKPDVANAVKTLADKFKAGLRSI